MNPVKNEEDDMGNGNHEHQLSADDRANEQQINGESYWNIPLSEQADDGPMMTMTINTSTFALRKMTTMTTVK